MSQLPTAGLNQRASDKFAPPPIEINPRVSVDNRFNEAGEAGTLAAAADNNWISSILSRQLDRASVKADPKFSLTVENLNKYMQGLPDEWADEFSGAGSDEEARVIRAQLKRRMSNMQTLQEAGWTGTAANLASNVVDPIAFGAGLLSGGAGWVEKGGRLARLAKAGMLAAAGTVPITAYQESQDPDGTVKNVLYNTAGAMLLGSLGHAAGELATGRWAIKTMRETEASDIAMLPPGATTEKAKIAYAEELSRNRLADEIDAEVTRAVSESDTHADDFTGLAEAARKNELEVIDVDALDPQRTSDVEVEVPGVQKVSESDTSTTAPNAKVEPQPPLPMLEVNTPSGPKPAWSMTQEEFTASVPLPDKKEKITVPALAKRLESSKGSPGYTVEYGIENGSLTDRITNVVYRGRSGNPIGILSIINGEDGKPATVRVAVMAQSRRRGIASQLYQIADGLDLGIADVSGKGSLTKDGAALVHRAQVEKAIRQGLPVPPEVRSQYPSLGKSPAFLSMKDRELAFPKQPPPGVNYTIPRPIVPSTQGVNIPPPPRGPMGPGRQLPPPGGPLSTIVRKVRDFIAKPTDSLSAFGPARWGMSGRLGQAPVPEVRMAASVYAQDSLARKGGEAAPYAATTWASREYRSHMAEVEREAEQHVNAYLKRNGVPAWKSFDAKVEFQKAVSWQLEGAPVGTVAPEVEAVANLHRQKYAELLDTLKRHGVPGFDNIPADPNYFPHLHNVGAVNAAIKDWGHAEVAKLYEMGLVKAGWDPVDAARVAPGFLDGILNLGHFSDLDKLKFFMGDAESLKAVFKRFNTGLSDADAERIAEFLKPKDAGLTPRAKRRTDLDTLVRISKTGANGQREDLWLHQLMETNAQAVLHKYTRQALGAAAEAEILRAMGLKIDPSGATTFKNFDELQDHIIRQYKAKGILTDRGPGKRDMDRLVALRKAAVGIPLHETGILSDVSRLVRAYNFIRGSGTFGIAQAVELGKVIGEIGFEPVMQQMPALRQIWKRAQNGTMTNELLAEMEEFIAAGTEGITHQVTARFDDQLGIEEFAGGGKLETLARRGEKLAGEVSGLVPITAMQQRMAGAAASQKVLNLAMSGRPLSARRLADIGLDAAMWDRIVKQVKQHATSEPGMLGRRLKRFNFDNWTDTEAGASLTSSLDLWSRRVIQDSDVGAMALWMTNPSARMLVQFRTFALQAWEKQFLRGIQVRDARAFLGFALTGAFGAMAYMGQQYVGALTDKEKAKKLKKNLSAKNIALQGFARSGASSILPSMIDFTLGQFKQDPLFDSRYSGLSSRGLMSNPSFELLDSGAQFAKGLGGLVTGKPMTRSEFKAGTRLIPLQGVLGVRNGLDAIADEFPKTTK